MGRHAIRLEFVADSCAAVLGSCRHRGICSLGSQHQRSQTDSDVHLSELLNHGAILLLLHPRLTDVFHGLLHARMVPGSQGVLAFDVGRRSPTSERNVRSLCRCSRYSSRQDWQIPVGNLARLGHYHLRHGPPHPPAC